MTSYSIAALCLVIVAVDGKDQLKPFIDIGPNKFINIDQNKPSETATPERRPEHRQATPETKDPVLAGLRDELAALKRNKINVEQLEHTAVASKALLHESQEMRRAAVNLRSRQAYDQQVHNSAQVQKQATGLLEAGMVEAGEEAREALQEATAVQSVAKSLAAEASAQLKMFAHVAPETSVEDKKAAAPGPADDDTDSEDVEDSTD